MIYYRSNPIRKHCIKYSSLIVKTSTSNSLLPPLKGMIQSIQVSQHRKILSHCSYHACKCNIKMVVPRRFFYSACGYNFQKLNLLCNLGFQQKLMYIDSNQNFLKLLYQQAIHGDAWARYTYLHLYHS